MTDAQKEKKAEFFNFLKNNKILAISIDPGYDSYKIYINGRNYSCKSLAVKVDTAGLQVRDGAVVSMLDEDDKITWNTYAVGSYAHNNLRSAKQNAGTKKMMKDSYDDSGRFGTAAFKASYYAVLFYALKEYASSKNETGFSIRDLRRLSEWKLSVMFTVPYAYAAEAEGQIKSMLLSDIHAKIQLEDASISLDRPLEYTKVQFQAQVLAAYRGMYMTNYGEIKDIDKVRELQDKLECLVIDSGYHTCGIVEIDTGFYPTTGNPEVDEEVYSMEYFDMLTAEAIKSEYKERIPSEYLKTALISDYCEGKLRLGAMKKDGSGSELVDVKSYRDKILEQQCSKMRDYLNRKIQMLTVKAVYVTGGTGENALYSYLMKVFSPENWATIEGVYMIDGYDVNGESVGAVFGVAYGGYTILATSIRANAADYE